MPRRFILLGAGLLVPVALLLAQPTDEAPPPEQPDEPVIGNVQPLGWGLEGPQGRHYFFGGIAMVDYVFQNRHRVVSLVEETQTESADPKFLYYRELGDGHRWAVAKAADRDRTYTIYFQPRASGAAVRTRWTLHHRARLIEDSRFPEDRRAAAGGATRPGAGSGVSPADRPPVLSRPQIVLEPDVPCCGQ